MKGNVRKTEGSCLELNCAISADKTDSSIDELSWKKTDGVKLIDLEDTKDDRINVIRKNEEGTNKIMLKISDLKKDDQTKYYCILKTQTDVTLFFNLVVNPPGKLSFKIKVKLFFKKFKCLTY